MADSAATSNYGTVCSVTPSVGAYQRKNTIASEDRAIELGAITFIQRPTRYSGSTSHRPPPPDEEAMIAPSPNRHVSSCALRSTCLQRNGKLTTS